MDNLKKKRYYSSLTRYYDKELPEIVKAIILPEEIVIAEFKIFTFEGRELDEFRDYIFGKYFPNYKNLGNKSFIQPKIKS